MTTALYRRYRPETFEDVIGQEHVTEPLMTALRKNRVNHAYLFSGPRGCGKTTSARILARCLNCAEGPTATPCGHCESCRDLARDGAGSLDVIEMDAASHGGVDHARDLRERATFAPVRDRYKIFIIDEAHMVTREGFNALLKIVEEPPEHVKFIFATTEPSKVLTTIRSRTHHYPFRLVPPEPLMKYLEQLCREEGVATEPGVLSLVVRAGGGSVRDSLSVLDQLMAGSGENGITYDLAVALLGYTHAALLDDVVDAFAAGDAATVFASVDRVIQTGQDPRRFVEDLLERFRDLVVVNAVPDSADNILHGMPTDQINRLRNQSTQLGAAELSRSADIINEALNEMTGATSPQLHLELLCARILLPAADHTTRGITSRVDRLERRLSIPRGAGIRQAGGDAPSSPSGAATPGSAVPATAQHPQAAPVAEAAPVVEEQRGGEQDGPSLPVAPDGSAPAGTGGNGSAEGRPSEQTPDVREPTDPQDEIEEPEGSAHPAAGEPVPERARGPQAQHPPADGTVDSPQQSAPAGSGSQGEPSRTAQPHTPGVHSGSAAGADVAWSRAEAPATGTSDPGLFGATSPEDTPERAASQDVAPQPPRVPDEQSAPSDVTSGELELLRSSWPEIVSALAEIRRVAWAITVRGTPISYENATLRIAFEGDGDILNFPRFEADVRSAIQTVVGLECAVEAVRPGDTQGGSRGQDPRGPGPSNGPRGSNGPGPAGGLGPSRGRGPAGGGSRPEPGGRSGQESGRDSRDQPDYFREPEGFGVNRRRGPQNGTTAAPSGAASAPPASTAAPSSNDSAEDDDEPVTSWSVAAIPQPGESQPQVATSDVPGPTGVTPATDPSDTARPGPDESAPENAMPGPADLDGSEPERAASRPSVSGAPEPGTPEPGPATPALSTGDPSTAEPSTSELTDLQRHPRERLDGEHSQRETSDQHPGQEQADAQRSERPHGDPERIPARVPDTVGSEPSVPAESSVRGAQPDGQGSSAETPSEATTVDPGLAAPGTSVPGPASSPQDSPQPSWSPQVSRGQRSSSGADRQAERGPEYWSPDEPPPPPEDEPPADMYDAPLSRTRPAPPRDTPATAPAAAPASGGHGPVAATRTDTGGGSGAGAGPQSGATGKRPSWRERHAAAIAAAQTTTPSTPDQNGGQRGGAEDENFVPGADDESLEDSSLYGRAAIERILGGMLIDERAHDANQ